MTVNRLADTAAEMPAMLAPMVLQIAIRSITLGLETGRPLEPTLAHYPPRLRRDGASFVSLKSEDGHLRGCIGSIVAHKPLAADIAESAFKAAFQDPRFSPLTAEDWPAMRLSIAILSDPVPWPVTDEDEAVRQLRPGVDGVILHAGEARGVFLPVVWQSIPEPREFLMRLKQKAGLPANGWEATFKLYRFRTSDITEPGTVTG